MINWTYAKPRFHLSYPELIQKLFYPGGGVPIGTLTADKELMDDSGSSEEAGILRKSS